jgi:hypothetical protein
MRPVGIEAVLVRAFAMGSLGGTDAWTQRSSVAASGAMPGEAGNTVASPAGRLSITVSRVSIVVPCRA